jgi:hypothetical protein
MDIIKGQILADGTVKITTDAISGPNHLSADRMIKGIEELLAGPTTVTKRTGHARVHEHDHGHEHLKGGQ